MATSEEKTNTGWRIVLLVALFILLVALVGLTLHFIPRVFPPVTSAPSTSLPTVSDGGTLPKNPIDFAALRAKNPETVAWISIPDTPVHYPIMQSGNDRAENYYLNHTPEEKTHRAGSIYIQKINAQDFTNPNTVIYGHNMANGSMFAYVRRYQNKDFFDKHRYITVYTPEHILTYEVYSAFVYDNRHILNSFNFFEEDDYMNFLQQTLNPTSMNKQVREGVSVTTNARIITLSTCTARSNERFLVVGVLIHDQQTQ